MRSVGTLALFLCVLLASCRSSESPSWSRGAADPERLDSLLRERLGFPPESAGIRAALDPLLARLRARPPRDTSFAERVRAIASVLGAPGGIASVTNPDDTDLVPSLAIRRGRGGCVPLAFAWRALGETVGLRLEPVLLPGHVTLRDPAGRFVDPLSWRERSRVFYDSAFRIAGRPAYADFRLRPLGLEAAMAIQGGLLAWKSGRLEEAREAFEVAARSAPGLPEAEGNLGLVLDALGARDSARAHLSRALAGDPLNEAAARRLEALR